MPETSSTKPARWPAVTALFAVAALTSALLLLLRRDPVDQLIERMGGSEQQAAEAQEELEALAGPTDLTPWRRALDIGSDRARYLAAEALSRRKGIGSARLLETALYDYSADVRVAAVQALPHASRETALRPVVRCLRDDDAWVRERAAMELRFLADPRSVPALIRALRDPDRTVATLTVGALRHITKQPWHASFRDPQPRFQAVVARWEEWWRKAGPTWPHQFHLKDTAPYYPTRTAPAPLFVAADSRGGRYRLQDARGRVVLVHFWATWCASCVQEMPTLNRIAQTWPATTVEIVGLAVNERSADSLRSFVQANPTKFKVALASHAITEAFGRVDKVPVTFLVDSEGAIRYRWDGPRDYHTLASAIRRVLETSGSGSGGSPVNRGS